MIKGYKPKIKEGEWTNITCVSTKSIPSANLTWTINNKQVSKSTCTRVILISKFKKMGFKYVLNFN